MRMGRIKQRSLDSIIGLADKDLGTPSHDELFIRFLDPNEMVKVILPYIKSTIYFNCVVQRGPWYRRSVTRCESENNKTGICNVGWTEDHLFRIPDSCPKRETIEDCYIASRSWDVNEILPDKIKINPEYVIKRNSYVLGFVDYYVEIENPIIANPHFALEVRPNKFIIEIKPEVKNIGQTLRQMNFYSSNLEGERILITKTKTVASVFKKAGVHVHVV